MKKIKQFISNHIPFLEGLYGIPTVIQGTVQDLKEGKFFENNWHKHIGLAVPIGFLIVFLCYWASLHKLQYLEMFRLLWEADKQYIILISFIYSIIGGAIPEFYQGLVYGANRTEAEGIASKRDHFVTSLAMWISSIIAIILFSNT